MEQLDSQSSSFDRFDFNLKTVFIFNPLAQPQKPKPSESDIQDAKLIFYHPEDANIEEKRNQVGMAEGFYVFCDSFTPDEAEKTDQSYPQFQIINLICQTHIIYAIKQDLFYFFTFSHEPKQSITTAPDYYAPECHHFIVDSNSDIMKLVCINFVTNFQIWCASNMNVIASFIPKWIQCYSRGNDQSGKLNLMAFQSHQIKFAPLDGHLFLTLQFLKSMIHQIEPSMKHIVIFYHGYFIFSTFKHQYSAYFKDHYFGSGMPLILNEQKISQKFKHHEQNNQDNALMNFVNLKNITNWDGEIKPQKVYLPTGQGEQQDQYDYFTYFDKQFLILLFIDPIEKKNYSQLKEIHTCVQRNLDKLTIKMDYFIDQGNQKVDQIKYIYYNGINLAFKVSGIINFSRILQDYMKVLCDINSKLNSQSFDKQIVRMNGFWFCGLKVLGRTIIVILGAKTISMSRLEEELKQALQQTFPALLL